MSLVTYETFIRNETAQWRKRAGENEILNVNIRFY